MAHLNLSDVDMPSAATRSKLAALAAWHDEWAIGKVDKAPFSPAGRKPGSDYNQHYVDIDGDDDAFHTRANQIMAGTVEKFDPAEPRDKTGEWSLVGEAVRAVEAEAHSTVATNPRLFGGWEGNAWGAQHFPAVSDLPPDQRDALLSYSDTGFENVNKRLRGDRIKRSERDDTDKSIAALDKVMATHRVPEDVTVTRGATLAAFGGKPPKVGAVLQEKGFLSTAVNDEPTNNWGSFMLDADIRIEVPKGTPGFYLGLGSHRPHEQELLLGRGQKLVVKSVQKLRKWEIVLQVVRDA